MAPFNNDTWGNLLEHITKAIEAYVNAHPDNACKDITFECVGDRLCPLEYNPETGRFQDEWTKIDDEDWELDDKLILVALQTFGAKSGFSIEFLRESEIDEYDNGKRDGDSGEDRWAQYNYEWTVRDIDGTACKLVTHELEINDNRSDSYNSSSEDEYDDED